MFYFALYHRFTWIYKKLDRVDVLYISIFDTSTFQKQSFNHLKNELSKFENSFTSQEEYENINKNSIISKDSDQSDSVPGLDRINFIKQRMKDSNLKRIHDSRVFQSSQNSNPKNQSSGKINSSLE